MSIAAMPLDRWRSFSAAADAEPEPSGSPALTLGRRSA